MNGKKLVEEIYPYTKYHESLNGLFDWLKEGDGLEKVPASIMRAHPIEDLEL